MPIDRGNRRGVARTFSMSWNPALFRYDPRDCNPSSLRPLALQRFGLDGGSETIRRPPTSRKRTAHSAVTAGEPNERAVTRSNFESDRVSRARTSARPRQTLPPDGTSSHWRTSSMKFVRFSIESKKTIGRSQVSNNTKPGRPPPLPRSRTFAGGLLRWASQASIKPMACSICGSMAPGPKKPRALDSSRARDNQCDVTRTTTPAQSPRNDGALRPRNE